MVVSQSILITDAQARHLPLPAPLASACDLTTDLGLFFFANCLDLFGCIKNDSIDCVFADPPFNLGKDYGNGAKHDDLDMLTYLDWSHQWIDEAIRVVKPGGAIFVYILPRWGYHLAAYLEAAGMSFRHWIAMSMKGTFPRGRKLYPAHYALLYFTKGTPNTFNHVRVPVPQCRHCGRDIKDYGGHRKYLNPLGLNLTDLWEDTAPARHKRFKARWHINELKPIIPSRCIQISTNPGDIVLDPFGGGGSTYEAAQELGRFWIGSELVTAPAVVARFRERYPLLCDRTPPPRLVSLFREDGHAEDNRRIAVQRRRGANSAARTRQARR